MREQAGIWQRVSTGGQDEASQLPDLVRWCQSHDYEQAKSYVIHGASAFKGNKKFDAFWAQVLAEFKGSDINVLVVWNLKRLDRKLHATRMIEQIVELGGRVEFVTQPHLNQLSTMGGRISLTVEQEIAHAESLDKGKAVKIKQEANRRNGSVNGRAPWGYQIVKQADGRKIFAPTSDGRKCIPVVFQMLIDGASLRDVAALLTDERVSTAQDAYVVIGPLRQWNEGYLGNRLVKNPVYYGARRNAGALATEGLVTYSVWQQANAALASRNRPGRGTVANAKALLAPVCGNPDCDATGIKPSPMYRVYTGKNQNRVPWYRCTGSGPQRKGCGFMRRCDELDATVLELMLADDGQEHYERVFIPGDDRSDEIGRLRESAMNAYAKRDMGRFAELDAQANELDSLPKVAPHWENKSTGRTEALYFALLDADAQRQELARRWAVVASRDALTVGPKAWT